MTINGHPLIPVLANWRDSVRWTRQWQVDAVLGATGREARVAPRVWPRSTLRYTASARSQEEGAYLQDVMRAATQAGRAAVPWWGWGNVIAGLGAASVTLADDSGFSWSSGDWIVWLGAPMRWAAAEVQSVVRVGGLIILSLNESLSGAALGDLAWPVLFGAPAVDQVNVITDWHIDVPVTITQLAPRAAATVGEAPPAPLAGVGAAMIGSTFTIG